MKQLLMFRYHKGHTLGRLVVTSTLGVLLHLASAAVGVAGESAGAAEVRADVRVSAIAVIDCGSAACGAQTPTARGVAACRTPDGGSVAVPFPEFMSDVFTTTTSVEIGSVCTARLLQADGYDPIAPVSVSGTVGAGGLSLGLSGREWVVDPLVTARMSPSRLSRSDRRAEFRVRTVNRGPDAMAGDPHQTGLPLYADVWYEDPELGAQFNQLPPGVTVTGAETSAGRYDRAANRWVTGTIRAGRHVDLKLELSVAPASPGTQPKSYRICVGHLFINGAMIIHDPNTHFACDTVTEAPS